MNFTDMLYNMYFLTIIYIVITSKKIVFSHACRHYNVFKWNVWETYENGSVSNCIHILNYNFSKNTLLCNRKMSKFTFCKTHFPFTTLFLKHTKPVPLTFLLFFFGIDCSLTWDTGEEFDKKEQRQKKRRNKSYYNSQSTRCDVPCVATISAGE